MKAISFEDIRSLDISPSQCYAWVDYIIAHKKEAILPPKVHMNMKDNVFCNVMPSIVAFDGKTWGGVKVVTRYPKRIPSLDSKILLFDAGNGEFLAIMDADWITAMRTGAVAAHSVFHFAKKEYQTIAMLGLGNTARATLVMLAELAGRELHIELLRYKDQAEKFMERFAAYPNLCFSVADDPASLVKGADVVISCATFFSDDICSDDCFDEGVLVVPVHTRGFTNCDLFFDKIYADDTGHVSDFRNFSRFRRFAEVSDVINGRAPGRENDRERILAYNIGISVHDVFYAAQIYQLFQKDNDRFLQLQDIDLCEPMEKYWV